MQLEELKERNVQVIELIKNNAKHKSNQLSMRKKVIKNNLLKFISAFN